MRLVALHLAEKNVVNPFTKRPVERSGKFVRDMLHAGFTLSSNNAYHFSCGKPVTELQVPKGPEKWKTVLKDILRSRDADVAIKELLAPVIPPAVLPARLGHLHDPFVDTVEMTHDQRNALRVALRGFNMFIGGSAGTGKTMLLKAIAKRLLMNGVRVGMTASTGVAAVQLGGCTFHHAFGVPVALQGPWDANALRAIDTVILDECSMMSAEALDELDRNAKQARLTNGLFGGLQLILCGDFMQLSSTDFEPCFLSPLFRNLIALQLVTPLRQREDNALLQVLRRLRVGEYDSALETLKSPPMAEEPLYLFPKVRDVDRVNQIKLQEVKGEQLVFSSQRGPLAIFGPTTVSVHCRLSRSHIGNRQPHEAITTGLRGAHFHGAASDVTVMPLRGRREEFSVRCARHTARDAWVAMVTHAVERLEGTVLGVWEKEPEHLVPTSVTFSLSAATATLLSSKNSLLLKVGCRVMVVRNLSRTVSNGSLGTLVSFDRYTPTLIPRRENMFSGVESQMFPRLPLVRLQSGELIQVPPTKEKVGGGPEVYRYGYEIFSLPLKIGYAFTVHKVQGITIDGPVVLNVDDFFDCPHLIYVACSRVRKLEHLTIQGLNRKKVTVNRQSLQFSSSLPSAFDEIRVDPEKLTASWPLRSR